MRWIDLVALVFGDGSKGNGVLIIAGGLDGGNIGFVSKTGKASLDRGVF